MKRHKLIYIVLSILAVIGMMSLSGCSKKATEVEVEAEAELRTTEEISSDTKSSIDGIEYDIITDMEDTASSSEISSELESAEETGDLKEVITEKSYEQASKVLDFTKNSNYSAFSLYYSLAMLNMGAEGETKNALDKFLGANIHTEIDKLSELMTDLNKEESPFKVANAEFVSEDVELEEEYRKIIQDKLMADVQNLDFKNELKANEVIDSWIYDKTNGMIEHGMGVTQEDVIDIINAVYFKDSWDIFKEADTKKDEFTTPDGNKVEVDMMSSNMNKTSKYYKGDGFETLKIPMNNSYMLIALPENSLEDLNGRLDEVFTKGEELEGNYKVNIKLPKFKFETSTKLDKFLKANGLDIIYSTEAEFGKIGVMKTGQKLYVNTVNQKTAIEVNEKGVEAAAVTEIGMRNMSARIEKEFEVIEFVVDRPAVFSICTEDRIPMFVGVLANPVSE